jgi:ribosome-binding protein aMBF1 (putative translation factor)
MGIRKLHRPARRLRGRVRNPLGRKGVPTKHLLSRRDEAEFCRRLGHRIMTARTKLRLTQDQLGQRLGASQGRIAAYETGRAAPRVPELPVLCRELHTDPNTLLDFDPTTSAASSNP